nr:hypothetical protein Iba_chr12cCG21090 [Ipomoea batatas]
MCTRYLPLKVNWKRLFSMLVVLKILILGICTKLAGQEVAELIKESIHWLLLYL